MDISNKVSHGPVQAEWLFKKPHEWVCCSQDGKVQFEEQKAQFVEIQFYSFSSRVPASYATARESASMEDIWNYGNSCLNNGKKWTILKCCPVRPQVHISVTVIWKRPTIKSEQVWNKCCMLLDKMEYKATFACCQWPRRRSSNLWTHQPRINSTKQIICTPNYCEYKMLFFSFLIKSINTLQLQDREKCRKDNQLQPLPSSPPSLSYFEGWR